MSGEKNKRPISHRKHLIIDKNHREAAKTVNLTYYTSDSAGISRHKNRKGYDYKYKGKIVRDKSTLERIRKLAIPPSWSDVWICPSENGHLQATGFDLNKRKQYRYHSKWNDLRNETKFHRMYEFGKALPIIREKVHKDLAGQELNEQKVLATAINLMEQTYIRIGNSEYEKLYGSYGLTTLKDNHVTIKKEAILFSFKGKKGIEHTITLKNKKLARIVRQCRDLPGRTLFQYYSPDGERKSIDSGMVNSYIREAAHQDFSAKDFRTWAGTLEALDCISKLKDAKTVSEAKKNVLQVLDDVSAKLGNTRNICKKYYVHPGILRLYEENKLLKYVKNWGKKRTHSKKLNPTEQLLMSVLKKCA